jgi:hypothetical protein
MHKGNQGTRQDIMRGFHNGVEFLKVVILDGVKYFLGLSNLHTVQVMVLQLKVNLIDGKVVEQHQICQHLWLVIAKVDTVVGHLLFDCLCVEFLDL